MSVFGAQRPVPYQASTLDSNSVSLDVRQHPQHALVTPEHKDKVRKQVDPPPIVQLKVEGAQEVPQNNWLVNPFLFMTALLVHPESNDGSYKAVLDNQIIGQNVSSLHRLKDIDNRDGGFFVFGDLSIRHKGTYRLQFNLFDYDKEGGNVVFINSVVSDEFSVVPSKDFGGMMESTHLSRTFSDQGVRLRLRKEPRTIAGKRALNSSPPESETSSMQHSMYGSSMGDRSITYDTPRFKRQRSDSEYGSNTYNVSPQSAHPLSNYRNALPSSNYGSSEVQNTGHYPQNSSFDGTMSQHPYTTVPTWQRPQQGPVSAPPIGSNDTYLYMQRSAYNGTYGHPPGPQYQPRPSLGGYPAFTGYQTTSSIPDSGLVSPQQQGFIASNFHTSAGGMNGAVPPMHIPQQNHQPQDPYMPTGTRLGPLSQPSQTYQPNLMSPQNHPSYEDRSQPSSLQFGQLSSQGHINPLQRAQHDSVQQNHAPISDNSLPLDSGLLNRTFAPAYQPQQQEEEYATPTGQQVPEYGSGQPQTYSDHHVSSNNS